MNVVAVVHFRTTVVAVVDFRPTVVDFRPTVVAVVDFVPFYCTCMYVQSTRTSFHSYFSVVFVFSVSYFCCQKLIFFGSK